MLSRNDVQRITDLLKTAIRHDECFTCDCLQGFLTQLDLDAEYGAGEMLQSLKVPTDQMHGCLGCEPCPPGKAYADYLRRQAQSSCSCSCSCKKPSSGEAV